MFIIFNKLYVIRGEALVVGAKSSQNQLFFPMESLFLDSQRASGRIEIVFQGVE
jgi:hypothetical protein